MLAGPEARGLLRVAQTEEQATNNDAGLNRDPRRRLTGASKDVAQLLFNLAKTARSFGFYARNNRAIQVFLDELFEGFTTFLSNEGPLWLAVGADRFIHQGEVVYFDSDREDGLPFKLFRDGIRVLTIEPGLDTKEMESFLDLLWRRPSTGRAAEEEDLVTMMWRHSFSHIKYQAVEGFTHDLHAAGGFGEGEGEGKVDSGQAIPNMMAKIAGSTGMSPPPEQVGTIEPNQSRGRAARSFVDRDSEQFLDEEFGLDAEGRALSRRGRQTPVREGGQTAEMLSLAAEEADVQVPSFAEGLYPGSRDYPLSLRGGMVEVRYEPLDEKGLAKIREEMDEETEIGLLHLLDYCFELSVQKPDLFGVDDFTHMLAPIRRYLLRQRSLGAYRALLRYLRRITEGGVYPSHLTQEAVALLQDCSSPDNLATLVAAASGDKEAEGIAWGVLQQLLPDLEAHQLLELLGHSMSASMANILAGTLIKRQGRDLSIYDEALDGDKVPLAFAALRCLAVLRTPAAVKLVEKAMVWWDPGIRRAAVRIAGRVPATDTMADAMTQALRDDVEEVRNEALAAILYQEESRLVPVLAGWLDETGFASLDSAGRDKYVAFIVRLDPDFATTYLASKLAESGKGWLGSRGRGGSASDWHPVAIQGLAAVDSQESLKVLRQVRTKGTDEMKALVSRLLTEKRQGGGQ